MEVKKQRGEPIRLLVEFLRRWYWQEELSERLERLQPDVALDREYLPTAQQASRTESDQKPSGRFDTIPSQASEIEKARSREKVSDASDRVPEPYHLDSATARYSHITPRTWALYKEGRYEDAIAICDEVVSRFSGTNEPRLQERIAKALVNKGWILGTRGHDQEAIRAYDEALTLNPTDATAWYRRDMTLFALNRWDEALAALDDALSRFPEGHEQLAVTPADESLRQLLTKTDAARWQEHIKGLIALYEKHHALAALGLGLVRGISTLYSPMLSNLAAQRWRDTWYDLGNKYEALQMPLGLLNAAVRYRETQDQRVLLRLPIEARKILEQMLPSSERQET
jgi:tetratricopeptide (TPR) repeat protein